MYKQIFKRVLYLSDKMNGKINIYCTNECLVENQRVNLEIWGSNPILDVLGSNPV